MSDGLDGDATAVSATLHWFNQAVRARDTEAVVAMFAEDGVCFGSGAEEHAQGHDAIRAMMTGLFELPVTVGWEWQPPITGRDESMVWFVTTGSLVFEVDGAEQRRAPYRISGVIVESDEGYRFALFNGSEPVD